MWNNDQIVGLVVAAAMVLSVIIGAIRAVVDTFRGRTVTSEVAAAEKKAFQGPLVTLEEKLGSLFDLYSKQIEKYQQETRSRASQSFLYAIIAMFAGLGFVVWGGYTLLSATETIVLAAGGLLGAIGGAVSAYITKTFLDVHKLSVTQMNRYFRQPVINHHIVMAQRLAEESSDDATRKRAYERLIEAVTGLIRTTDNEN